MQRGRAEAEYAAAKFAAPHLAVQVTEEATGEAEAREEAEAERRRECYWRCSWSRTAMQVARGHLHSILVTPVCSCDPTA